MSKIEKPNVEKRVMKKKVVSNAAQKRIPLATSNIQNKPTLTNKDNGAKGRENKVPLLKGVKSKQNSKSVSDENADVIKTEKGAPKPEKVSSASKVVSKIPKITSRMSTAIANPVADLGFSSKLLLPPQVENIDSGDTQNILLAAEFVQDIYIYLRRLENSQSIKANFLSVQKEMTPKMRSVLVDWLINVHTQFRLLPETLYLGISIMDRFFEKEVVSKDKIQLVGVTAFFIASKFEEIYPPDIKDFIVICDQLYHKRDIIKMEMVILKVLKFELGRPLPLHFLRRYSKAAHADAKIHTLAKYLMELTLVEYDCAHWNPSLLAATALYVTLKVLDSSSKWNPSLAFYSNYPEEHLLPYASHLCQIIKRAEKSRFQSCRRKYNSSKLLEISKISELKSAVVEELAEKSSL